MDFDIRKEAKESDQDVERALRPLTFGDFRGQDKTVENLSIFVQAARLRGEKIGRAHV